jgi:putative ubiquitin-RnfH superfamily antitoxin RatB of RatAB toxin-antitoxin module
VLQDGDRVEAYRPLRCDPKEARRLRYRQDSAPARRVKSAP